MLFASEITSKEGKAKHEDYEAYPFVDAQPGDAVGVIDAQAFDEEASECVCSHVDDKQSTWPKHVLAA